MTVKVLVTALGQQIVADTKQIENKETNDLVGYWMENPRVVAYQRNEEGEVSVNFAAYCMVSDESAFSIKESYITSILEVREDVLNSYKERVFGNESSVSDASDGADSGDDDGTDGVRTTSASGETDDSVGEDEAQPTEVA